LQTFRVSTLFAAMGVHVPFADASEQLRQAPVQAVSQQTPSTQKPDAQSAAAVHVLPFVCLPLPQLWFWQAIVGAQSAFVVHIVLHAPDAQVYGMHSWTPGALHVPCPSHVPGVLRRVPAHDGSTHTVSAAYIAHDPKPSHAPVWPHFAAPLSLQIMRGSGTPWSMGQQVPTLPVWLHETHAPWQATAQHTPSVQKPDAHSSFVLQLMPRILSPQLPAMHCTPGAQSAFVAHSPKQSCLVASQENGTQTLSAPGPQVPLPSHVLIIVTAAPLQVPGWQTVSLTYLRHAPWPSQVPSVPHVPTAVIGQVDAERGGRPAGTNEHVPIEPFTSQRLHVSPHALSQQTPSTQKPDWQSLAQPHASPLTARMPPSHVVFISPVDFVSPPRSGWPAALSPFMSRPPSVADEPPPHPSCAASESAASATITFKGRTK
jgi:hypothetical protein